MHATATFSSARDGFGRSPRLGLARLSAGAGDEVLFDHRRALQDAVERAERAERRLRARVIELTWPAALSSMVGGVLTIAGLRLLGL